MRFALPAAALLTAITVSVWAQTEPPPLTAPIRTTSPINSTLTPGSPPNAAAPPAQAFPASFVVELKGVPAAKTASGFEVAIIAALGALAVAVYNAWRMGSTERMKVQAAKDTEDMKLRAAEGLQMVRQAFEAAQEEARRIGEQAKEDIARAYEREKHAAIQAYEKQKDEVDRILQTGQHNDKITLEMRALQLRADVSDAEAYMAVKRLNHERDLAQANLISTFFSKLLSESQRERDLALFAISAFVDPERLAQLAAGGEAVVSRESLSRLAARGADEIAAVAQRVLNDGVAAFRSGIVRIYRQGSAQMVSNGFICHGDLVVTYPIVSKDEIFEVQWGADGARAQAICLAVDAGHFLAVGWVQTGVVGKPLALRDTAVRSYETQVRVAQWSEGQFIVRAGMVVATDAKENIQYGPDKSREVSQVMNLRVLSEAGSAGAPVLDEDGRVAGVIFGGEPGQESSFAAPASAIKGLLSNALVLKATLAVTPIARDPAT